MYKRQAIIRTITTSTPPSTLGKRKASALSQEAFPDKSPAASVASALTPSNTKDTKDSLAGQADLSALYDDDDNDEDPTASRAERKQARKAEKKAAQEARRAARAAAATAAASNADGIDAAMLDAGAPTTVDVEEEEGEPAPFDYASAPSVLNSGAVEDRAGTRRREKGKGRGKDKHYSPYAKMLETKGGLKGRAEQTGRSATFGR